MEFGLITQFKMDFVKLLSARWNLDITQCKMEFGLITQFKMEFGPITQFKMEFDLITQLKMEFSLLLSSRLNLV